MHFSPHYWLSDHLCRGSDSCAVFKLFSHTTHLQDFSFIMRSNNDESSVVKGFKRAFLHRAAFTLVLLRYNTLKNINIRYRRGKKSTTQRGLNIYYSTKETQRLLIIKQVTRSSESVSRLLSTEADGGMKPSTQTEAGSPPRRREVTQFSAPFCLKLSGMFLLYFNSTLHSKTTKRMEHLWRVVTETEKDILALPLCFFIFRIIYTFEFLGRGARVKQPHLTPTHLFYLSVAIRCVSEKYCTHKL